MMEAAGGSVSATATVLAVVGSMYAFAGRAGVVPEGTNPAHGIDKFKESHRERFLTGEELERLGSAIREAESTGIPWTVDASKPTAKHVPKANQSTKITPSAAAALRLLLLTGCRLREILHLRWEHVDFERGCLFLPTVRAAGRRSCHDLKRPWNAVTKRAGLIGVRLHDLRHTYASFGAAGGPGLPIIGRLLGHTQAATTARYAHLDNDLLRRASEAIAGRIAAALEGKGAGAVLRLAQTNDLRYRRRLA
jgi:integrase